MLISARLNSICALLWIVFETATRVSSVSAHPVLAKPARTNAATAALRMPATISICEARLSGQSWASSSGSYEAANATLKQPGGELLIVPVVLASPLASTGPVGGAWTSCKALRRAPDASGRSSSGSMGSHGTKWSTGCEEAVSPAAGGGSRDTLSFLMSEAQTRSGSIAVVEVARHGASEMWSALRAEGARAA